MPAHAATNVVALPIVRIAPARRSTGGRLSQSQRRWLARGLREPGGKLPLFDEEGRRISDRTVKSCIRHGWVEPWFDNPGKADWLVCKLTDDGRRALAGDAPSPR